MFNEAQMEAVNWFKGPAMILGTPGSGKTTVIINRLKHMIEVNNVKPSNILVITFTRAAADSMEQRFINLMEKSEVCRNQKEQVRFGTFHSFFYWIIRTAYKLGTDSVLDEDEKRRILRGIIQESKRGEDQEVTEELLSSVLSQLGLISCDMIDIENYYSKDMAGEEFKAIYRKFSEYKRRIGKIDFDDMNSMCYELLIKRPDILAAIKNLYPYILVDEFQDTNKIQYEILKLLAKPENNLFVVGDDDQSIYGFRGARPEIMLGFPKEFEGTRVITLSINYRCPEVITKQSGLVIANNKKRFSKKLISSGRAGDIIVEFPRDVKNENEMIVSRIKESYESGVPYDEIAVLYRTNMNPRRLIYKLKEYNIPFLIKDSIPNIFNNFAVSVIMDYIHFALGDNSRDRFLRIMNKPVRYIPRNILTEEKVDISLLIKRTVSKDYLHTNCMVLRNQLARIRSLTPFAAVNYIRKTVGYDDYLKDYMEERNIDKGEISDILDEFMSIAKEYETFEEFFGFIEEYTKLLSEEAKRNKYTKDKSKKVTLMTMHSSKGLEYRDVHIIECVEEIIPHKKSKTLDEIEEERRMFYVAMTRTIEHLYIYAPKMIGEKKRYPSRFITEQIKKKEVQ